MNLGGSFTEQGEGWPSEHGLVTLEEPCHCLVSPRMGGDAPEAASVECAFSHLLLCLNANTFREYKTTGQNYIQLAGRRRREHPESGGALILPAPFRGDVNRQRAHPGTLASGHNRSDEDDGCT